MERTARSKKEGTNRRLQAPLVRFPLTSRFRIYNHGVGIRGLRLTLQAGSLVFGLSALFLIALPGLFLTLLALEDSAPLRWSMRMIGITVFALAGNMWNNAKQQDDVRVIYVARVMCISAALLGLLTLLIPVELTWFGYLYAAIGFGFSISYLLNLIKVAG